MLETTREWVGHTDPQEQIPEYYLVNLSTISSYQITLNSCEEIGK